MRMRRLIATAMVILAGCSNTTVSPQRILPYDPEVCSLSGTIQRRLYPGPPDYTDDTSDDVVVLVLDAPISVRGHDDKLSTTPPVDGVKEMQILLPVTDEDRQAFLDRRVVVKGRLFAPLTGHHHTEVLMNAYEVEIAEQTDPTLSRAPQSGHSKVDH